MYASVERDFGTSPEAWDLRARRHVAELAPDASAAQRGAAVQAGVAVYEAGLAVAPSPELLALLLAFLQQQLAALDSSGGGGGAAGEHQQAESGTAAAGAAAVAAEWVRQCVQQAYVQAQAAGLLTEGLWLDAVAFYLHCGDAAGAAAATHAAVSALPESPALWRQLLVLEAGALAAEGQLAGQVAGACSGQADGSSSSSSSSSSDDDGNENAEEGGGMGAAQRRRLESLAMQALHAVPSAEAAPVWLTTIAVLAGAGCSLAGLAKQLMQAALRQSKGPVEVSGWG